MASYTIDTLEKLCHNETTAEKACLLFYKLANSDNELKTEAETAFSDLFYIALSETTLTLDKRIEILSKIEYEFGITTLIIDAYRKSLKSTSFIGKIRNSNEAFKRSYYLPNNPEENQRYFKNSINKLTEFTLSDKDYSDAAKKAFYSQISEQVYNGERILMLQSLKKIIHKEGKIEIDIRNLLLEYNTENDFFSEEVNNLISDLINEYKPQNIEEELKVDVIEAPWIHSKKQDGHNENLSAIKAGDLAIKYCQEGINWLPNLKLLLQGEQRQTFYFAQKIGEFYKNNDKHINELLEQLFECFLEIPKEQQNSLFVNGLVIGINNDLFTRELISKMISNKLTELQGIIQIRFLNPIKFEDIEQVKEILIQKPDYFKHLQYLKLKSFTKEDFVTTIEWIKDVNYSFALEMIYDITRSEIDKYDKESWLKFKEIINSTLYQKNVLKHSNFFNSSHHIEVLFIISINEDPSESNIKFLAEEILSEYCDFNSRNDSLLDRLTFYLLEERWEIAWKYYGDFLSGKKRFSFGLNYFLEKYNFDNQKLYDWVEENPELNSALAIKFMKVYLTNEEGNLIWNPKALEILNKYGNNKLVLLNLSSRLFSYSINTYSAENLFRQRKILVEQLLDNQFPEVVEFAKIEINELERRIEDERRFGENYELGR